jgi:quercetin dioxygenase-like cupin family protein
MNVLIDLVQYQESSIVSHSILKNKAGNVTIFAFAKNEGLSEHTAPFEALIQIVDGIADVTISGKMHHVSTGQFIILPANEPHSVYAPGKFKMVLTMIKS